MRRMLLAAFAIVATLLLLRLAIVVRRAETGLETLITHWRAATLGWFTEDVPLHELLPIDQAHFWLKEADRITAEHPDDPEIWMGAALVLANPCEDFRSRHFQQREGDSSERKRNGDAIQEAKDRFEIACARRRLELAKKACNRAPNNLNMRRFLALLASQSASRNKPSLDDAELNAVLSGCVAREPDNALYDYLAAYNDWRDSTRYSSSDKGLPFETTNPGLYARCFARFERGIQKRTLDVGADELTMAAKFLELSRAPRASRCKVLDNCGLGTPRANLYLFLWRAQLQLIREAEFAGDFRKAIAQADVCDHIVKQAEGTARRLDQLQPRLMVGHGAAMMRRKLARDHLEAFSIEDYARYRNDEIRERVMAAVALQGVQDWRSANRHLLTDQLMVERPWSAAASLLVGLACNYCAILAIVAAAASLFARWMPKIPLGRGDWLMWLLFPVAVAVTLLLFGLCPAQIIPIFWQEWTATLLLVATLPAFVGWIVWRMRRTRQFRFSLFDAFIATTFICLLLGLLSFFGGVNALAQFPLPIHISSRSTIPGMDEAWQRQMEKLPLFWQVTLHWLAYYGQYLTLAIWLGLLALVSLLRARRGDSAPSGFFAWFRSSAALFARQLTRSSLLLLVASLLIYLAFAPSVLQMVEEDFQWRVSFARNPRKHLEAAQAAVAAVRADPARMAEITAKVEEQIDRQEARKE